MTTLITILLIGAVIILIGFIMFLYLGFTQRILWGLAILFLPYVELLFTVFHWQRARTAFLAFVIGHVMFFGAAFGGATEQMQDVLYEGEAGYTRSLYTEEEISEAILNLDSYRFGNFEPKPGALTPPEVAELRSAEKEARQQEKAAEEKRRTAELDRKSQNSLNAILEDRALEEAELRRTRAEKEEIAKKRAADSRDAFIGNSKSIDSHLS